MKVKKEIIFIITSITLILFFTGCIDSSLQIYEAMNCSEDEGGINVTIDGVEYIQAPATKWHIQLSDNIIGYAGSRKTKIVEALGDTKRNFIVLIEPGFGDNAYPLLHRTNLLEPSADSINKIYCSENDYNKSEQNSNWVTDKDIIREFFDVLETGGKIPDTSHFKKYAVSFSCYSDEVPGAVYLLNIMRSGDRLICGNYNEGYVEINLDLLEKIAGKQIDINKLLEN